MVPGRMITVHYEMEDYLEFRSSSNAKYLDDKFFSVKFQHLTTHILPQSPKATSRVVVVVSKDQHLLHCVKERLAALEKVYSNLKLVTIDLSEKIPYRIYIFTESC